MKLQRLSKPWRCCQSAAELPEVWDQCSKIAFTMQAPPGSGKSSRIPLAILDAGAEWLAAQQIILVQPNAASVPLVAEHIAHLRGESLGTQVGV